MAYTLFLICYAASGVGIEAPAIGPDLIPLPPTLPATLPDPVEYDDGVFLARPLDHAVRDLLEYCQTGYPRVCATAISKVRRVEGVVCDGRLAVTEAQCLEGRTRQAVESSQGWSTIRVIGVVGIAVVGGLSAGYLLGRALP